ncbi:hypothetical protein DBR32_14440 [Taibaiella sp. KBW10]|nr:hypothetical protein DBR32_14440 [Taibaiella sp. KBW10]
MYYWKTNVSLSVYEQKVLDSLGCKNLYVRFFDVDWNSSSKQIVPVAGNTGLDSPLKQQITPVVFITQTALNNLAWNTTATLAQNIAGLLEMKCNKSAILPKEIQIDCDWTVNNKDMYFDLLQKLKQQPFFKQKVLSVTIRLHQVKYITKNGVPPVDKGLLMCYNMGKLKDIKETNSILNVATARTYLGNMKNYPLKLDVALPIFYWCILFEKEQFKGILRDIDIDQLQDRQVFTPKTDHVYLITKDTLWNGFELKEGQIVRYENSNTEEVQKLATFVAAQLRNDSVQVLLYHCDRKNFLKYNSNELEKIYTRF